MKRNHAPSRRALRRLGLYLLSVGATTADVAEELGVTRATVCNWALAWRAGRREQNAADSTPVLTVEAHERLPDLMAGGAGPWGFVDGRWTLARLAYMLEIEFGLRCSTLHVFELLGHLMPQQNQGCTGEVARAAKSPTVGPGGFVQVRREAIRAFGRLWPD